MCTKSLAYTPNTWQLLSGEKKKEKESKENQKPSRKQVGIGRGPKWQRFLLILYINGWKS